MACLYEHQTGLSPRCEGAVWSFMERLGKVLANMRRDCDRDGRQFCNQVVEGGGDLVACFLRAR
jgi:hypothetical protein